MFKKLIVLLLALVLVLGSLPCAVLAEELERVDRRQQRRRSQLRQALLLHRLRLHRVLPGCRDDAGRLLR